MFNEADVRVNGTKLTTAQSLSLRVAVTNLITEIVTDTEFRASLGDVAQHYIDRLREVEVLMIEGAALKRKR